MKVQNAFAFLGTNPHTTGMNRQWWISVNLTTMRPSQQEVNIAIEPSNVLISMIAKRNRKDHLFKSYDALSHNICKVDPLSQNVLHILRITSTTHVEVL